MPSKIQYYNFCKMIACQRSSNSISKKKVDESVVLPKGDIEYLLIVTYFLSK